MPSFYPSHMASQPELPVQSSEYGNGYKDACYHGLTDDYPGYYPDHRSATQNYMAPMLTNPFDRFPEHGPSSNMYRPNQPYTKYSQPIGAPMLPPLRIDERYVAPSGGYAPRQQQTYQSEPEVYGPDEKALGGVSATLDYEMEEMADFVVEATVGMYELCASPICIADIDLLRSIRPSTSSSSSFRKWILQVLNATRLPSATILLSLSYLARRVRQQAAEGTFKSTELSLYRMLTTALILGSKFLDDNTFQNKSWAEVSNIDIADINRDEREWLMSFNHRLHNDPRAADGFNACSELWHSFKARLLPSMAPLQPIDTNVQRQRSLPSLNQDAFQPQYAKQHQDGCPLDPRLVDTQYPSSAFSTYESWYGRRSSGERSPASAPHTGPHTPEYLEDGSGWGTIDRYNRPITHPSAPTAPYLHHVPTFASDYGPSFYSGHYQQNHWNCHGPLCQCSNCRYSNFMPQYGPGCPVLPVVG